MLSVKQVAEILNVRPRAVKGFILSGQIPAVKLTGRLYRVDEKALDSFLVEHAVKPPACKDPRAHQPSSRGPQSPE